MQTAGQGSGPARLPWQDGLYRLGLSLMGPPTFGSLLFSPQVASLRPQPPSLPDAQGSLPLHPSPAHSLAIFPRRKRLLVLLMVI